jgi:hypothetical protein
VNTGRRIPRAGSTGFPNAARSSGRKLAQMGLGRYMFALSFFAGAAGASMIIGGKVHPGTLQHAPPPQSVGGTSIISVDEDYTVVNVPFTSMINHQGWERSGPDSWRRTNFSVTLPGIPAGYDPSGVILSFGFGKPSTRTDIGVSYSDCLFGISVFGVKLCGWEEAEMSAEPAVRGMFTHATVGNRQIDLAGVTGGLPYLPQPNVNLVDALGVASLIRNPITLFGYTEISLRDGAVHLRDRGYHARTEFDVRATSTTDYFAGLYFDGMPPSSGLEPHTSSSRFAVVPTGNSPDLADIPEPGSLFTVAFALVGLLAWRNRPIGWRAGVI